MDCWDVNGIADRLTECLAARDIYFRLLRRGLRFTARDIYLRLLRRGLRFTARDIYLRFLWCRLRFTAGNICLHLLQHTLILSLVKAQVSKLFVSDCGLGRNINSLRRRKRETLLRPRTAKRCIRVNASRGKSLCAIFFDFPLCLIGKLKNLLPQVPFGLGRVPASSSS